MAFMATTPEQSALVQRVILEIENDPDHMRVVQRAFDQCQDKRVPAGTFRQRLRPMIMRFWTTGGYPPTADVLFCLAWLWINTMGQPPVEFAQSSSPATERTIEALFKECLYPPPLSVQNLEPVPLTPGVIDAISKEIQMTPIEVIPQPPFETRHYVYGRDVAIMTAAQLIDAIKQVESEIKELNAIEVKSAYITKTVDGLLAMRDEIVARLDVK